MAVVTVSDVLNRARDFEQAVADFYRKLSEQTSRPGVRLLADYMSRRRARVAWAFDSLPSDQVRRLCSTPLRYEPRGADCRCLEEMQLPVDAAAGEVLDMAANFDECLIRLYRQVARQAADEEVRDFFESFIRLEHREQVELEKIKAMNYF